MNNLIKNNLVFGSLLFCYWLFNYIYINQLKYKLSNRQLLQKIILANPNKTQKIRWNNKDKIQDCIYFHLFGFQNKNKIEQIIKNQTDSIYVSQLKNINTNQVLLKFYDYLPNNNSQINQSIKSWNFYKNINSQSNNIQIVIINNQSQNQVQIQDNQFIFYMEEILLNDYQISKIIKSSIYQYKGFFNFEAKQTNMIQTLIQNEFDIVVALINKQLKSLLYINNNYWIGFQQKKLKMIKQTLEALKQNIKQKNIIKLKENLNELESYSTINLFDYRKYFLSFALSSILLIFNPLIRIATQNIKEIIFDQSSSNNSSFFMRIFEYIISLQIILNIMNLNKFILSSNNETTQLIETKQLLDQTVQEYNQNTIEHQAKMKEIKEEENKIKKEDYQSQKLLLKYYKYIEENKIKKQQLEKHIKEEELLQQQLEQEIQEANKQLQDYQNDNKLFLEKTEELKVYQNYLQTVVNSYQGQFTDIEDMIKKFQILQQSNEKLKQEFIQLEQQEKQISEEHSDCILVKQQQINILNKEIKQLQRQIDQQEIKENQIKNNKQEQNTNQESYEINNQEQIAKIMLSVNNVYDLIQNFEGQQKDNQEDNKKEQNEKKNSDSNPLKIEEDSYQKYVDKLEKVLNQMEIYKQIQTILEKEQKPLKAVKQIK